MNNTRNELKHYTLGTISLGNLDLNDIPLNGKELARKRDEIISNLAYQRENNVDILINYYISLLERDDFKEILKSSLLEEGAATLLFNRRKTLNFKLPNIRDKFNGIIKEYESNMIYVSLNQWGIRFDIYKYDKPLGAKIVYIAREDRFESKNKIY